MMIKISGLGLLRAAFALAGPAQSSFSLDKPNVMLVDVKQADFGDPPDVILRLQEIGETTKTSVRVQPAFPMRQAKLDNLVEERVSDLAADPLVVEMGKYETATVRVKAGGKRPE